MTGNIFPKRFRKPKHSTSKPTLGQPAKMTRNAPTKKVDVARSRDGFMKNDMVLPVPTRNGTPERNKIFPKRSSR